MRRYQQRARIQKIEREQRERDMIQDPATYNDNQLAATIYVIQGRLNTRNARLTGQVDPQVKARLDALLAEQAARRAR